MRIVSSSLSQSTGCTPPGTGTDDDSFPARTSQTTSCDAVAGRATAPSANALSGARSAPHFKPAVARSKLTRSARHDMSDACASKTAEPPFRGTTTATGSESSAGAGDDAVTGEGAHDPLTKRLVRRPQVAQVSAAVNQNGAVRHVLP